MNEEKVKKRGWVKNAAIIFLAVMLVLTFFSNTIMNHSLPEVAAEYAKTDTLSPKVRGTSNIEAVESYTVKSEQNRTVLSVPVKVGDKVAVGDTLLLYGQAGGEELKTAQDALDALMLTYQKALVNSVSGQYSAQKAAVKTAQNALDAAKAKRDANTVSIGDIANVEVRVQSCQSALTNAQNALTAFGEPTPPSQGDYSKVTAANNTLQAKKLQYSKELLAFSKAVDAVIADDENFPEFKGKPRYIVEEALAQQYKDGNDTEKKMSLAYTSVKEAQTAYDDALNEYNKNTSSGNMGQYNALKAAVNTAESNLAAAKSAQEALLAKKNTYDAALTEVTTCQNALQEALLALEKDTAIEGLDLSSMRKQITAQNKVIADLKGSGDGSTVTSKVNGVVTAINVTAGDAATSDKDLMVVEVPDRGYKASISVTKEQSKKVKVGDIGEVQFNNWGNPMTAKLIGIRPDPEKPTTNKMLDFSVEGESVESGSQVTIAIGEKSANYDVVIKKSAIRSDANGKFVLAVVAKNSPLGNRYIATRVDIEVLAEDDVNCAVSGALLSGDFVITTSTKPVDAGTQVRLADQVTK